MKTNSANKIGRAILALITLTFTLNLVSCADYGPPPVSHRGPVGGFRSGGHSGGYEEGYGEGDAEYRRPQVNNSPTLFDGHTAPTQGRNYGDTPSGCWAVNRATGQKEWLAWNDPKLKGIIAGGDFNWKQAIYRDKNGKSMPGPGNSGNCSDGPSHQPVRSHQSNSGGGYHATPAPGCTNEYGETREQVLRAMNEQGIATYHALPPAGRR